MKKFILLILITSNLFANTLTDKEENEVLTVIDNICGDSWCEGEYNFRFNSLICHEQTESCVLHAELILYTYDKDYNETAESFPQSCIVKGYTSFDSMVDQDTEYGNDIAWPFYEAVSECIMEMEERVEEIRVY